MKRTICLLLVVGLICSLWFSCAKKEPKVYKIGAILPLTGPVALVGQWGKNGIELAVKDINTKGGINGKPLKLFIEDDTGDPKISVAAFKKLVSIEKSRIILTAVSSVSMALVPLADKSKVILFSHASHPMITGSIKYVFRHSNVASVEAAILSGFLSEKLKSKKIAIIVMNDDYGLAFRQEFMDIFKNKYPEVNIVKELRYEKTETDFKSIAKQIVDLKPNGIIVCGLGKGLGILIKRLREYNYQGDIVSTLGFIITDAFKSAGSAGKGIYYANFDITKDEFYNIVNEKFKKEFGRDMISVELLFYNTMMLLSESIKNVGYDPAAIAKYIKTLSHFKGTGEIMEITPKGDIVPKMKVEKY